MKHIQKKAMLVMIATLHFTEFSQSGLHKAIQEMDGFKEKPVSLAYVNKVVLDLKTKGFIVPSTKDSIFPIGSGESTPGQIRYHLADPLGVLRYIALFRRMDELKEFSMQIEGDENIIKRELASEGAIFCLGSAQIRYSKYFRPDSINFYHRSPKGLMNKIRSARPGKKKLNCFKMDFNSENGFSIDPQSPEYTTKVQTVLDMFCNNEGVYTKSLLKELWGIEIQ